MPAWSVGCDTIERFELSFNGRSKTEIVRREIIDRKGELLALHLGLLADVVTFRVPPQGKDKKKVAGKLISPGSTSQISKSHTIRAKGRIWLR